MLVCQAPEPGPRTRSHATHMSSAEAAVQRPVHHLGTLAQWNAVRRQWAHSALQSPSRTCWVPRPSALSSARPANGSDPDLTEPEAPNLTSSEQAKPMDVDSDAAKAGGVLQPSSPGR